MILDDIVVKKKRTITKSKKTISSPQDMKEMALNSKK
mgnify:CR=1 FL=1